jgi:hypothetical protein
VTGSPLDDDLIRCVNGRGCVEVTSRLQAADQAASRGHHDHAARMRDKARRFAEEHRYGTDTKQ